MVHTLRRLRSFVSGNRGSAAIELALGAVVLLSAATLCFDLYSRIRADTASGRLASVMADYVSRDAKPNGDELKALGKVLYKHELRLPADLVYVITAFRRPPDDPPQAATKLWSHDTIRFGDETATSTLAGDCPRYVADGEGSGLPSEFDGAMAKGEVLIVVEICARLTREGSLAGRFIGGEVYRLHAVPHRDPGTPPSKPA